MKTCVYYSRENTTLLACRGVRASSGYDHSKTPKLSAESVCNN